MFNNVWEEIQEIYFNNFGIPPQIVDKMAALEILRMCADGRSNSTICLKFDLPADYLRSILIEYFDFDGWVNDLDISPIVLYNAYGFDYRIYKTNVGVISNLMGNWEVKRSYNCCKTLVKIEREVARYVK